MVLAALSRFYGPANQVLTPPILFGPEYASVLDSIMTMKQQKHDLESQARKLDTQIKRAYAPIVELMGPSSVAFCEQNGLKYSITYNPKYREGVPKEKLSILKAQHPDIYDEFVKTSESRIFKVEKTNV